MNDNQTRTTPFSREFIERLTEKYPTPFHIYDERAIRENARRMNAAFSWVPGGYKNYFAVKALPNPAIMQIVRDEGMGFDCSSMAELALCERLGVSGEEIMFTSNDTPAAEYRKARELGAIINLDDITHVPFLERTAGFPDLICLRYNPGQLRQGNAIIGKPEEAKYGFTREQLIAGYADAKKAGAKRFGLHTMVASNELDPEYFVETAAMLFDLVVEIHKKTGIKMEFVNLGGGVGIPYRPDQTAVDLERVSRGAHDAYRASIEKNELAPVRIVSENGRVVTGPYGYLVSRVIHTKDTYKKYVGLDASMANLMRPGMYGAYHHITVLGKENTPRDVMYDVTGSLCENNDKFAIDRALPRVEIGDFVAIHDTGAHGHSMGFNYNGKLRSAELLLRPDGTVEMIRRAETLDDHFATLDV
ncbi:MAG: diaminopimelate decarboxylase [Spirochaetaceae bacterium]|nr:MAG: diaminopimelate decarboxylase [Spirochaetaceae bacterium]